MKKYKHLYYMGGGLILLLFTSILVVQYSSFSTAGAVVLSPVDIVSSVFKWMSGGSLSVNDKIAILRLERVLAATLSGMLLSVGGTLYQTTLMNPLVDPYLLGVSAGASLGAVIAYRFHLPGPVWMYAFIFSLVAFSFSYILGRGNRLKIVLSGVVISSLVSACITLVLIMWNDSLHNILAWLMGSFSMADGGKVMLQVVVLLVVMLVTFLTHRVLDIMLLGDEIAFSVGVNVDRYRLIYLVIASLAASFVAAFYGIVSFVGLMAPHIARQLVGDRHLYKLILSLEIGAILLVVGDFLSRSVMYPMEVPIGVFTSVVGGIFFLYLVVRGEWL